MLSRPVTTHNTRTQAQPYPPVMRQTSPYFAPPVPCTVREPGTRWGTIWTAPTPPAGASNPRMAGKRTPNPGW